MKNPEPVAIFLGDNFNPVNLQKYPRWMHHKLLESILVKDTQEKMAAIEKGYSEVAAPMTANRFISNWFWDLEDMSAKQLRIYALEEYGVDLPKEASQEKLFRSVLKLGKNAPQNRQRLVLMAHTVAMNYNETIKEIKKMVSEPHEWTETQIETMEIML